MFAIHRIKNLIITEDSYTITDSYNFDHFFNQSFGVIKEDSFEVSVQFTEFAAAFISERVWNSESRKEWVDDDTLILTFEASSKPELIGWILSWAGRAKVLEPNWLAEEVHEIIHRMAENIS